MYISELHDWKREDRERQRKFKEIRECSPNPASGERGMQVLYKLVLELWVIHTSKLLTKNNVRDDVHGKGFGRPEHIHGLRLRGEAIQTL